MLVVSDTTALSCLFKIGRLSLLPAFSPQILIPLAVRDELKRLEEKGINILAGQLCVRELELMNKIAVGRLATMDEILDLILHHEVLAL